MIEKFILISLLVIDFLLLAIFEKLTVLRTFFLLVRLKLKDFLFDKNTTSSEWQYQLFYVTCRAAVFCTNINTWTAPNFTDGSIFISNHTCVYLHNISHQQFNYVRGFTSEIYCLKILFAQVNHLDLLGGIWSFTVRSGVHSLV